MSEALRLATVALRGNGGEGTGFFVAPRLVLTCAHVVAKPGDPLPGAVTGTWGEVELELEVLPRFHRPGSHNGPDLALLRSPIDLEHACPRLGAGVAPGDELWIFGYPSGTYRGGDAVRAVYEGPSERSDGTPLLRVANGVLGPGHSGAPALNWRTGLVCGMVRSGENISLVRSPVARLEPARVVLAAFPHLGQPPPARSDWLDLLTDEQLAAGDQPIPGPRLREYLRAVRDAAREHPYRLSPADAPPLPTVYLRQWATAEQPDSPGPEYENADDVIDRHTGVQIIGEPGMGKSSLLRHITERTAGAWLDGHQDGAVPILVHASALTKSLSLPDALAAGVIEELGPNIGTRELADLFTRPPLPGVAWLVLVDGLDEVLDQQRRSRIVTVVARHRESSSHLRFVLTSRPLPPYATQRLHTPATPTYVLERFTDEQLEAFAEGWFAALRLSEPVETARTFVTRLQRGKFRQLARVPLIATMLCIVFAADPQARIPLNRAELYERFVRRLLNKAIDAVDMRAQLHDQVRPYGAAAQEAADSLLDTLPKRLGELAHRLQYDLPPPPDEPPSWPAAADHDLWRAMVNETLRQCGLLVERGDTFVFIHQTIQEFLAARHLAHHHSPPGRWRGHEVIEEEPQWPWRHAEVMLFMVGIWADRGDNIKPALLRLLRHGQVEFVAELAHRGVPLPPTVSAKAVTELRRQVLNSRLEHAAWAVHRGLLIDLDPDVAAQALAELARNPNAASFRRLESAQVLLSLDEHLGKSALEEISRDSSSGNNPVRAARLLFDHDRRLGVAALNAIVRDTSIHGSLRVDAGHILLQSHPEAGVSALTHLVRDTAATPDEARLQAARILAPRDTTPLRDLATQHQTASAVRIRAATELAGLDHAAGLTAFQHLATDRSLTVEERLTAIDHLPDPQAADALHTALADHRYERQDKELVADRLGPLDPGGAADALIGIVDHELKEGNGLKAAERLRLVQKATRYSPDRGVPALREFATDRNVPERLRLSGLESVLSLSPATGLDLLSALSSDRSVSAQNRLDLAGRLLTADKERGLDALTTIAKDVTVGAEAVTAAKKVATEVPARGVALLKAIARGNSRNDGVRAMAAIAIGKRAPAAGQVERQLLISEFNVTLQRLRRQQRDAPGGNDFSLGPNRDYLENSIRDLEELIRSLW
ncbi:trypsin-like peptidase domain-containing protein [Nonomuraea sp. B12E4]